MPVSRFRALALAPEIPLPALARHFGIARRMAWEEPLALSGSRLQAALPHVNTEKVFLFAFGAAVFVDCDDTAIRRILDDLAQHHPGLHKTNPFQWSDDYTLTVERHAVTTCDNDGVTTGNDSPAVALVLATVLARSVALERVEASLETALDLSEKRIEALERGELRGADASLARDAGAVLRLEYESIHYLGLPDKPECIWTDAEADALYTQLARQFELRERFAAVRNRVDVLKDLGSTFANLAHARRSARLEWIIILLIAFEIVLPAVRWAWQTVNH